MKNRSFLFLIAALAMGLALFGCSTDSDSTTDYIKQGYASQVDAIAAAFEQAPDVYLTGAVEVGGEEMLLVKSGNRLHLESFKITVADGGGIAIEKPDGIVWDTGSVTGDSENGGYLIGPSGAFTGKAVTKVGTLAITAADATAVAYTPIGGRAIGATTNYAIVFDANGAAKATGGTLTVLITELFTVPATHYSNAGSLAVTGDVTLTGTLSGAGGFEVYGELTSNVADAAAGPVLVAGTLTARKITTKGGNFGAPVTIKSSTSKSDFAGTQTTVAGDFEAAGQVDFTGATFDGTSKIDGAATFTKPVTFTGIAQLSAANFSDDVTFAEPSTISGKAAFANGKKLIGKVEVTGKVSAGATSGSTLLLAPGGQIIYKSDVENSFLTGVGTLAALEGAGTVTFGISTNELAVSGAGSLVIGNTGFTLDSTNRIKVDGTTGVYFSTANGKIDAETYELGGKIGTLSNSNGAIGGFILSKDGISNAVTTNGSASLSYALENEASAFFLSIKNGSQATLTGVDINVTTGSISFGPSAILYLAEGGSVTAAGDPANGGYIVSIPSGSLVAGSASGDTQAAILAGSAGTVTRNYIHSASKFLPNAGSATTAAGSASNYPLATATTQGSISVFAVY
jgi:hypothetical protein